MVAEQIPPGMERVIEVPLDPGAQIVQPAHQREHLSADCGCFDCGGIHAMLPRDLSGEGGGNRPVACALSVADTARFCIDPIEKDIGRIDRGLAFLPGDHPGHRPAHDLLQHCPNTVCAHRSILKFVEHFSLSCLDGGQQAR